MYINQFSRVMHIETENVIGRQRAEAYNSKKLQAGDRHAIHWMEDDYIALCGQTLSYAYAAMVPTVKRKSKMCQHCVREAFKQEQSRQQCMLNLPM